MTKMFHITINGMPLCIHPVRRDAPGPCEVSSPERAINTAAACRVLRPNAVVAVVVGSCPGGDK